MIKSTYILISALLISCFWKTEKTNTTEENISIVTKKTKIIETEISNDSYCKCFNGIGASDKDKPLLTFNFSNGKSVSVCGYKDPDLETKNLNISEFNVFDCSNGKSYAQYGALQNCIIITKKDTLIIQLMKSFPIGENWKWKPIQIAEQVITTDLNEIKAFEIKPKYKPTYIKPKQQSDFLNSLKKGQGFGGNWVDDLGKLEVLSLLGNEKAWGILKNYEEYIGEKTDGALAEQWKDAVATVSWITEKNKKVVTKYK